MVYFVLKGGEYALRYLRYKQLSCKIVKMSLVDKELNNFKKEMSPSFKKWLSRWQEPQFLAQHK